MANVGVTDKLAVSGAVPKLVIGKVAIEPVPVVLIPILGVLLVQVYVVVPPILFVVKLTEVGVPLHNTKGVTGWFTSAEGFTVIVKILGKPTQLTPPLVNVGVTVIVATIGELPVLVAVKLAIDPEPESAGIPMAISLDQS